MEYIILSIYLILIWLWVYYYRRMLRYNRFREDLANLCREYNSWRRKDFSITDFDCLLDCAFDFAYYKYPRMMPTKLSWAWTSINMDTLLTDEMKSKFSEFLKDNDYERI